MQLCTHHTTCGTGRNRAQQNMETEGAQITEMSTVRYVAVVEAWEEFTSKKR
jgi:hypothetical protein